MHRPHPLRVAAATAAASVLALFSGCASTKNAPAVPTEDQSGFLEDYTNLRAGREGEPTYVFRVPNALASYDKVILEPVEVWRGEESAGRLSEEALQFLADYFYTLISMRLDRDYDLVDTADPTTMRIRVAYTRVGETGTKLAAQSSTKPQPNLITQFQEKTKEPPSFSLSTSVELAIRDALGGATLFAAIERKDLALAAREGGPSWEDLQAELEYDAERVGWILCTERKGAESCPRPVRGR
jgi:hypothetical protein